MRWEIRPYFALALATALSLSWAGSSRAGVKEQITVRRAVGVVFLGGSVFLTLQGFDYKDEADEFYDRYQTAIDPVEIDRLYQRTTNRDVKSQISWSLAAGFAISGVRLLVTGDEGAGRLNSAAPGPRDVQRTKAGSGGLLIQPRLDRDRTVGIELKKPFF